MLAAITDETKLIVIDASAFDQVRPEDLNRLVLRRGIAVTGLNVGLDELRRATLFVETLDEIDPIFRANLRPAGPLERPGYSIVQYVREGPHGDRWGSTQAWFSDGLFIAKLRGLGVIEEG
jgi:hypothetical protein